MSTNIDFWERVIEHPIPEYQTLFQKEKDYLHSHISSNSKVLDIGCGDGRNIISLLDITKDVSGIDSDMKAVEDAKENLKDYPSVDIQQADAFNLPFTEGTFDYTILMMTLVNFADKKVKALEEMKRVTKENGKIIISVYSDKALEKRLEMYKQIEVPITKVKDGYVTFDESVGAHTSEQFTKEQLEELANKAGLRITTCEEAGILAYLCTLERI
ncbi:MAG: class I SAM-dependent methyltransferase [bacterium]|nr:class I SAM-dependent methyltransferase [bacterium]